MPSQNEIEEFYKNQKKKTKKAKTTKCTLANKNCKYWDQVKQRCMRGWCAI